MKCRKAQRLLNIYIDNELPGQKMSAVNGHLAGCPQCAITLNKLTKLKELAGTTTPYTANPFLWTRIAEGIKEGIPIPIGPLVLKFLRIWVSIASVLILVSGITLYRLPVEKEVLYGETSSMEATIFEIPVTPENMEKITLNLLVYTNGLTGEVPYVNF